MSGRARWSQGRSFGARLAPAVVLLLAAVAGASRPGHGGDPASPVAVDQTLRRLVAAVGPGVVRIEVDGGDRAIVRPERRLFHDAETATREGGAGVVLRKDGLILTHAAIVSYAVPRIEILTGDGRRLPATVLARDAKLDIALLKADVGAAPLTAVSLGTTVGLEPGRLVLAFGNPFGVARDARAAASLGVVTFLGPLDAPEAVFQGDVIGTDAAVNPGDDGGPLVDLDGRVVGILAPLVRDRRSHSIVGFAIPLDAIAPRLEALARGAPPAHLGLIVGEPPGLVVSRVVPGGAADHAGVREGDKLVSWDGESLLGKEDLRRLLERARVGERVALVVERDGKTVSLTLALDEESDR